MKRLDNDPDDRMEAIMRLKIKTKVFIYGILFIIAGFVNSAHCSDKDPVAVTPTFKTEKHIGVIAGVIKAANTNENVIGASVELIGYHRGTVSDINGAFRIPGVVSGIYSLRIRCIGYETKRIDNLTVSESSETLLEIAILQQPVKLRDVVVTPSTYSIMETESAARQSLSRDDIETVSQIGEDIYRAVSHLPGIAANDFSSRFVVRGGEHEEILVSLDGIELYEPFHIKDINEGALSIIDAEAIAGIDLMTGGFTAEFGNRLSGVFNINMRRPDDDVNTYSFGFSLMNFRAMSEGVYDNDKGDWFLSARRGYLDIVLNLMKENEVPRPKYYDFLFTTRYQLHPRHTLSLGMLNAGDKMNQDESEDLDRVDTGYGNTYFWLLLKSLINHKLYASTIASAAKVSSDRFGYIHGIYPGGRMKEFEVNDNNSFNDVTFKQDWNYEISQRLLLKCGFGTKQLTADYDYRNFRLISSIDESGTIIFDSTRVNIDFKKHGHTLNPYISSRIKVMEPMIIELGIRYDKYSYSDDRDISPRLNGMYKLKENSVLRLGWGKFYQAQGIHELDVWDGKTTYGRSQLAEHWTIGFDQLFSNQIQLRLECYYKNYSRLRPAYRNWDTGIEYFPEIEEERLEIFTKSRIAKGVELFAKKDTGGPFSFWASYALAFAEETIDSIHYAEGYVPAPYKRKLPSPYDQRHTLYCDFNYRPNPSWVFNLSWVIHTGWPYTEKKLECWEAPNGDRYYVVVPDSLRAECLPAFHRLNVRITKIYKTGTGDLKVFLELINLYNRGNIFAYDGYDIRFDSQNNPYLVNEPDYWFRFLPSIGISWSGYF